MENEQIRLDDALGQADPMLVVSLKRDQRRRNRRLLVTLLAFLVLGVGAYAWRATSDGKMTFLAPGVRNTNPPTAAQSGEIASALKEFRKTVIAYKLGFEEVFPNRPPAGNVPARLADYPGEQSWPRVMGNVQTDPRAFEVIDGEKGSAVPFVGVTSPLRAEVASHEYSTVLCYSGVASSGSVVESSYASLYCRGNMAGSAFFGSYATAVVDGDFSGRLTANSYFAGVISGNFTGRIVLSSYAIVYIDKDFDGSGEIKTSTLVIGGRATRAALSRITGPGTVYVGESDLPAGKSKVGDLDVVVKGAATTSGAPTKS